MKSVGRWAVLLIFYAVLRPAETVLTDKVGRRYLALPRSLTWSEQGTPRCATELHAPPAIAATLAVHAPAGVAGLRCNKGVSTASLS